MPLNKSLEELLEMDDSDLDPEKLMAEDAGVEDTTEDDNKNEEGDSNKDEKTDWDRERAGLLKAKQAETKKRQKYEAELRDTQRRLDTLTGTVQAILQNRSKQDAADKGDRKKPQIIIEQDEDGNDVLPVDKLDVILAPYREEIENLRQMISANSQQVQQSTEQTQAVQQILGEDERFPKAHGKYLKARNWANNKVIEWLHDNGYKEGSVMTGEQAMDYVFTPELESEFQELFPKASLEHIVGNSKRSFRKALLSLAEEPTSENEDDTEELKARNKEKNDRFQKVLRKPSGLADSRNSKGGTLSVSDRIGELSAEELINMSDKEAQALEQALLAEEKSDGIKF